MNIERKSELPIPDDDPILRNHLIEAGLLGAKYSFNIMHHYLAEIERREQYKYILIGDNPGVEEFEKGRYFIGKSGQALRIFFEENLVDNFDKEVIVYNKTQLHTSKTEQLHGVRSRLKFKLFNNILLDNAEIISVAHKLLNVPVIMVGYSEFTDLFQTFWKEINKNIFAEDILVFKHPSHNHFFDQWNFEKAKHPTKTNLELLVDIGSKNRQIIQNRIDNNNEYNKT